MPRIFYRVRAFFILELIESHVFQSLPWLKVRNINIPTSAFIDCLFLFSSY